MVTHIPSPNSSTASLRLTSPTSSTFTPIPALSQAGSASASYTNNRRLVSSSQSTHGGHHRHTSSSTSASSQSTLVQSTPRSVAEYSASPPSAYNYPVLNTPGRAPSVASTSTSTSAARHSSVQRDSSSHRHRSGSRGRARRELEDESETSSCNSFPWFGQSGDVEIYVGDFRKQHSKSYMLHRLILAQNSGWFQSELGVKMTPESKDILGDGHRAACRLELDWSGVRDNKTALPLLIQTMSRTAQSPYGHPPRPPKASSRNRQSGPPNAFIRGRASSASSRSQPQTSDDADLLAAYDNLFLTFYNHSPNLSATNIATAYVESKLLLSLASAYSALKVVGPRIDHHLLQFGSRLWKQIAKYPPSYLKLGHLAKSKAIFSEALVHVVGQWPVGQPQLRRGAADDALLDLVEDKVDELEETKLRVEAKLFRINLTTGRGEKVGPHNAYVDWLAISLFRQWIAEHTAQPPPSILKDSSMTSGPQPRTPSKLVRTYRLLGQGGQWYLPHDELKRFLKLRPEDYSREALRKFERRVDELKHLAADAVRPLTRNGLELDVRGAGSAGGFSASLPSYLICVRCDEKDFAHVWRN